MSRFRRRQPPRLDEPAAPLEPSRKKLSTLQQRPSFSRSISTPMPAKRKPTARGGPWRALGLLLVAGFALGAGIFACGLTARTLDPARIGSPAADLSLVERVALGTYLGMRSGVRNRGAPHAAGGGLA